MIYTHQKLSSEQLNLLVERSKEHYSSYPVEANELVRGIGQDPAPIATSEKLSVAELGQNPLSGSQSKNTESGISLGKKTDDTGAHKSDGHGEGSIVRGIPALTAANDFTIPQSMGFDTNIRIVSEIEMSTPSKGKHLTGLYSLQVDVGETASVFDVRAMVLSGSDRQQEYKGDAIHKVGSIVPKKSGSYLAVAYTPASLLSSVLKTRHPWVCLSRNTRRSGGPTS